MADASWPADPTGAHELRYWNGTTWTEHVSDQGITGQDPLTSEPPPAAPRLDRELPARHPHRERPAGVDQGHGRAAGRLAARQGHR